MDAWHDWQGSDGGKTWKEVALIGEKSVVVARGQPDVGGGQRGDVITNRTGEVSVGVKVVCNTWDEAVNSGGPSPTS
jgi:hypothetical protein